MRKHFLTVVVAVVVSLLTACGGGGVGSTGSSNPPPVIQPPAPVVTVTTTSIPAGVVGQAYSTTLAASGGTPPYKWTIALTVPGLTLSSDGVLSGTRPADYGGVLQNIMVTATDSASPANVATQYLTVDIFGLVPRNLSVPQVNVDFSSQGSFDAEGGTQPIQWQVSGTLPPGMSIVPYPTGNNTHQRLMSGRPTQSGTYTFSVTATDSGTPVRSVTNTYTVQVEPAPLRLPNSALPVAVVGKPYSYSFAPAGGAGPFNWQLSYWQSTPNGLTFDRTTGILSGAPTTAGAYSFFTMVSDSSVPNRQSNSVNGILYISPRPLAPRNDSIATAAVVFPGTTSASVSPLTDGKGNITADQDYYEMTSAAGSTVTVAVTNLVYRPGFPSVTPLDPVVEIVDVNGHRLSACNDPLDDNPLAGGPIPQDPTPNGFDDPCMNWSGDGTSFSTVKTARLAFKVPGTTGNTTFYIHIFDWRGDARPDMFYELTVTQQ